MEPVIYRIAVTLVLALILYPVSITAIVTESTYTNVFAREENYNGLLIVTTFPNLVYDLKQIVCKNDVVESIAPPGVDPHEYQLTPQDIELLHRADVIVSTGHAPFEVDIREKILSGELEGYLVEIPGIPGIHILDNPMTGQPNYHMIIYDPINYRVFIENITSILVKLNPRCREIYETNAKRVIQKINELVSRTPRIYVDAVADTPLTQYAISWTGVRIKYLILKEHDTPVSPKDIQNIVKDIESGCIKLAIVVDPPKSKASEQLLNIVGEYGLPLIKVPSPLSSGSILEKLEYISSQVEEVRSKVEVSKVSGSSGLFHIESSAIAMYLSGVMLLSSIFLFIYMMLRGVRK